MDPSPIKEAAGRQDGRIWTGYRHGDVVARMLEDGALPGLKTEMGFVTEAGEFLSRAEAYERAVVCKQIADDNGRRILISEMLY